MVAFSESLTNPFAKNPQNPKGEPSEEPATPEFLRPLAVLFENAEEDEEAFLDQPEIAIQVDTMTYDASLILDKYSADWAVTFDRMLEAEEYYIAKAIDYIKATIVGDPSTRQIIRTNVEAFINAGNKYAQYGYTLVEKNPELRERVFRVFHQNQLWAADFDMEKLRRENLNNRIIVGRDLALLALARSTENPEEESRVIALLTEQAESQGELLKIAEQEWVRAQRVLLSDEYNTARTHCIDYCNNLAVLLSDLALTYRDKRSTLLPNYILRTLQHLKRAQEILSKSDGVSREEDAEKEIRALSNEANVRLLYFDMQMQKPESATPGLSLSFVDLFGKPMSLALDRLHSYPSCWGEFDAEVFIRLAEGLLVYIALSRLRDKEPEAPQSITVFDTKNFVPTTVNLTDQSEEQLLEMARNLLNWSGARARDVDDTVFQGFAEKRYEKIAGASAAGTPQSD